MLLLLFFVYIVAFSAFFLLSSYEDLVKWYTGLNDCFYKHEYWANDFFTPARKATGNYYCIGALIASLPCLLYCFRQLKKKAHNAREVRISLSLSYLATAIACIVFAAIAWAWGKSLVAPSNDEVFSAVNCAALPPFQTLSYYMLPNNHILFNLLNNVVFHTVADKVLSGRVISLFCYLGLVLVVFSWLGNVLQNRWLAFIATIAIALQFPVWGFGFQARGYELLALMEWVVLISLFQYRKTSDQKWLQVMAAASIAGYFTIPVFLYFHAAVLAFTVFSGIVNKRFDSRFWKSQFVVGLLVFLLYLPCLCFSGREAITGNAWVAPQTYSQLWEDAGQMWHNYMDYCFCNPVNGQYVVDTLLFLLPVCLMFFRRNDIARSLGLFYCAMWGTTILLTMVMKVFPIDRSLTGQFSIILALTIYTLGLLLGNLAKWLHVKRAAAVALPVILVLLSVNFVLKGRKYVSHYLCHFVVNEWRATVVDDGISNIPPGSSVGFSNESFFWFYMCKQYGYKVDKCSTGTEDYYVKATNEPFPAGMDGRYVAIKKVTEFYEIFKRK